VTNKGVVERGCSFGVSKGLVSISVDLAHEPHCSTMELFEANRGSWRWVRLLVRVGVNPTANNVTIDGVAGAEAMNRRNLPAVGTH
jgi:hypothetical protein